MNHLPAYTTDFGEMYCGDAMELFDILDDGSVNLAITSPPFALLRKKDYGNKDQDEYVDWLAEFALKLKPKLANDGSFVLDLGGAYKKGLPVRSLYNYKVMIKLCEEIGYYLAEEFFWFNPSKLPSPIEWVNKRKIRVKDAVNTVWWFSKTEYPKANVTNVLVPYSERMKKLLKDQNKYYSPKERPSGHDISLAFGIDNGGAIPSNLLQIPNTESNSKYLRCCKLLNIKGHPARFPKGLPEFFIKFLTEPGDLVLDFFAGSNTTGQAAEELGRRWISFEIEPHYVATSSFRFLPDIEKAAEIYTSLLNGTRNLNLSVTTQWMSLFSKRM
ncbi:site-specific DNA-methyltransferase (cytosine-N4-specific) [Desulfofundulus luciae]|uniref:Methyltransferase n=1 Tax=Desulfofundulus luciae TaxID=74702 RepID=A0ABU0B4T4_9FIRM|nr:site-specific DNA-methyltransferase [Desulfofundulus luciae]MDQ0287726.1 site-specific DNA-methyltransferase (cytosine-N4-specific) [Desulfofundulus luciae]